MIFMAIIYALISVVGCIMGVYLGKMIVGIRAFKRLFFLYYLEIMVYNVDVKVYEFVGWK